MPHAVPSKNTKFRNLLGAVQALERVAVAFSGGLDSTLLLYAARQVLGHDGVVAMTCVTEYMPQAETEEAKCTALATDVRHLLLDVPFPEAIRTNPPDRCYLCKRTLMGLMQQAAAKEGIEHVLDGTNLDDLNDYRPGLRALAEGGIKSPLLNAGLTKKDIRWLSKAHGLAWDKASGACLLSRIPHGTRIETLELRRIDRAEAFLKDLGFQMVRLRSHGELARIEVPHDEVGAVVRADRRHGIAAQLQSLGYRHVALDLAGYRMGSLNEEAASAHQR